MVGLISNHIFKGGIEMLVNLEIINGNPKTIIEYCMTEFPNGLIPKSFYTTCSEF